jgi:hypothetical protein
MQPAAGALGGRTNSTEAGLQKPALSRGVETFIPIPLPPDATPIAIWESYLELLRSKVAPLLQGLIKKRQINWYSFLVHNRQSGVPTKDSDNGLYVHIRMVPSKGITLKRLRPQLPSVCLMTRRIRQPIPNALDNANVNALIGSTAAEGWRVLGESSEWVLRMLQAHRPNAPIPVNNVAQFLHYLGNQLFVRTVGIPMP